MASTDRWYPRLIAGVAGAFALALVAIVLWAWSWDGPDTAVPRGSLAFARHFIHYGLFRGYGAGDFTSLPHRLDGVAIEPGDIVLGSNPHCVYGTWSHVTIVLGDGVVLGHDICSGMYHTALVRSGRYRHLRIVRPRLPRAQREAAAVIANGLVGDPFVLHARCDDPRLWTCAKTVYAAYLAQGLDLSAGETLVRPESIAQATADAEVILDVSR